MTTTLPSYISPQGGMHYGRDAVEQTKSMPSKSLYISHFISTWNSRGFEFGAVLFLATVYPGTLLPMSIYALIRAAAAIFFAPWVGCYIDKSERLQVVRLSILGQRIPVVLSCLGFLLLLSSGADLPVAIRHGVFAGLVFLACLEKLCSVMNTVSVERDWVVVIADGHDGMLQEMNSKMRRIDLFCKLVSPLVIALFDGFSSRVAVLITLGLNATTVAAEYFLIAKVYRKTPALARTTTAISEPSHTYDGEDGSTPNSPDQLSASASSMPIKESPSGFVAFKAYLSSAAFLPSFSLSLLYLTVLSFSGQMTTYLLAVPSPRLTGTTVGLLRTISTIFELSSTFLAPQLMSAIGPVRAGIWCLSWQAMCLTLGVGMLAFSSSTSLPSVLWLRDDPTSLGDTKTGVIALIITVMLSRIGLWSFDLAAQLLIQNSIEPTHRGTFSSVEASLQNFFELCTFATTIAWSKPEQFKYPAMVSVVAVWVAGACYAKFVRDQRGHLLHFPPCLHMNWSLGLKDGRSRGAYRAVSNERSTRHSETSSG